MRVVALYRFVDLPDAAEIVAVLQALCDAEDVCGTLLVAREGINGTIAGSDRAVGAVLDWLLADARFAGMECKESGAQARPFHRMKVRLKPEIVTLGVPGVDPCQGVGTHVDAADWNALIADPDVLLIDVRNDYEHRIGTFRGAVNPKTDTFTDFPKFAAEQLPAGQKIAMFCTGGIRCEKASAYLLQQGFDQVFQLRGGILRYLEHIPAGESTFEGACFVFDQRVALGHGLVQADVLLCFNCREPLTPQDQADPAYVPDVCCPRCAPDLTPARRASLTERARQIQLAKARGERHLGDPQDRQLARREEKRLRRG